MERFLRWLERFKTPITVVLVIGVLAATGLLVFHTTAFKQLVARAASSSDDQTLKALADQQQALMAELASFKLDNPAGFAPLGDAVGTTPAAISSTASNSSSSTSTSPSKSASTSTSSTTTGLVHLNTADAAALETLSDIGPTKAQAILDYRNAHGLFKSIDELDNVKGIGAATIDKLRPHLILD